MQEVFDNNFTSKYQKMSSTDRADIAKYAGVAQLLDNPQVQEAFAEIELSLLQTIPTTDADRPQDRESLFHLHKAVGLLHDNLRAKANEFHAMQASDVHADKASKPVSPKAE